MTLCRIRDVESVLRREQRITRKVGSMPNKLRLTFFSVLLLCALLLTWGMAPNAFAATPGSHSSSTVSRSLEAHTGTLPSDAKQGNPFNMGFRAGYRQGFQDGLRDCSSMRHSRRSFARSFKSEFERGFADGYSRGYNSGIVSCKHAHHR